MMSEEEIHAALRYDHAGGDKCGPERTIMDRVVVAAKDHGACFICFDPISRGTHNRVTAVIWDGEFLSSRVCERCCHAMALSRVDGADAIMARYDRGARVS